MARDGKPIRAADEPGPLCAKRAASKRRAVVHRARYANLCGSAWAIARNSRRGRAHATSATSKAIVREQLLHH